MDPNTGETPDTIAILWEGGDTFFWREGTDSLGQFLSLEARKVCDVRQDYRAERTPRNVITSKLVVFNSKPILSLSINSNATWSGVRRGERVGPSRPTRSCTK